MDDALTVATFPREDGAFAAYVARCRAELGRIDRADPAALERLIRRWHTRAVVRPRDVLAGFGNAVWYVYRDGTAGIRSDEAWWEADGVARVTFSEGGRFIAADEAACALVALPPGGLNGAHWTSVVPPEGATGNAEWLWEQLHRTGTVRSVFDCPLPTGGRRVIEYRSTATPQPGVFESRWRHVATISAAHDGLSSQPIAEAGSPTSAA